jgi:hypothetical protein
MAMGPMLTIKSIRYLPPFSKLLVEPKVIIFVEGPEKPKCTSFVNSLALLMSSKYQEHAPK